MSKRSKIDKSVDKVDNFKTFEEHLGFESFKHFGTNATHAGYKAMDHKTLSCPVVPPISLSTTFEQTGPGEDLGFDYSRAGNPTRAVLEKCIASLEEAKFSTVFSSGLAATNSLVQLLKSGDHILCSDDVYGGTNRYFRTISSQSQINATMVDMSDLKLIVDNFKKGVTKMVWMETPTNPLMKLIDIKAVVETIRNLDPEVLIIVDNTFMSSYFQHPLDFGADISMHSLTKYMNGHSDVVMGCCITNNEELQERLVYIQKCVGAVPSAMDCYLVLRGLRTLHVRMREHMRTGLMVAQFLESHKLVKKVVHPGLKSHPQHELAKRQMTGYSGMVTVYIDGDATLFVKSLKIFAIAESLGGYESLVEIPSIMTHMSVPPEQREKLGISDNMVRLSCGLEDAKDLLDDLNQALKVASFAKE